MAHDDRSWMMLPRSSVEWQAGLEKFIDTIFEGTYASETAPCPCSRCRGVVYKRKSKVQMDLLTKGFDENFVKEKGNAGIFLNDDRDLNVGPPGDASSAKNMLSAMIRGATSGNTSEEPCESAKKFFDLLKDAQQELWPGSQLTKVSFLVKFFQHKCMGGWSNISAWVDGVRRTQSKHLAYGWYGVLKKIIYLDFHGDKEVMLFQYVWFDVPTASSSRSRGYNKDKYGVIDIDITRFRYSDEPYILSTQAEQVVYARNMKKPDWCTVLRVQPRNLFAMPEAEGTDNMGALDLDSVVVGVEDMNVEQENEDVTAWSRSGLDGATVYASVIEHAIATAMPEPEHDDLFEEDEDPDDTYINDGVLPPFSTLGEDSDDDFLI